MTNAELKQVASRIKAKRKSLNYTQEAFSEKIGIALSTYTKIENGFQAPSLNTLIAISKELDVSMDFILFGYEKALISEKEKRVLELLQTFNTYDIKNLISLLETFL